MKVDCPKCKKTVLTKSVDGNHRLRSRTVVFGEKGCLAICPGCKAEVPVPVTLEKGNGGMSHYILK